MANQGISTNDAKKRARDELGDSDLDSPGSKLARAEPDPDELDIHSPEARRIQDDLLNALDGGDEGSSGVPSIQDLDSVIRSFEEEILVPAPAELGYLLEASDDELGLPPSFSDRKPEVTADWMTQFVCIDDQMPCYDDSFELGMGCFDSWSNQGNGNDFLPLGCLFEHTEAGFEPSDVSEISWRPESLSAM